MKFQTRTKVLATLLVAATAVAPAIASAASLSTLFHPRSQDNRLRVVLYNQTFLHDQVRVAGKVYDVEPQYTLIITAPAGTPIYAASDLRTAKNGELLFEITPKDEAHRLILD